MASVKIKNAVENYNIFGNILSNSNFTQQVSQTDTIQQNNRNYFISTNRSLLSYTYTNYGLIQVLIDQPVDDAFRGGIKIRSEQLSTDDIKVLEKSMQSHDLLKKIKQLAKWVRLYGGGGLVVNTVGKANEPIPLNRIKKDTPLEFYPADLWELSIRTPYVYGEPKPYLDDLNERDLTHFQSEEFFFYGNTLNNTRLLKARNKEAPSFLRPILRGWGMSEIERMIRDLNVNLKNTTLIFELLDEAKVDVMKINGFNDAMMNRDGAQKMVELVQTAMQIKNFQNALVMDKEDEFDQKQISFAGLSEMAGENRINIAAAMRMPITKIFGISSAGFNSGEDEIENYNAMITSEIRGHYDLIIVQALELLCLKEFGFIPNDLEIEFEPLRIMSSEQEENVKDKQLNRLILLYDRGLIDSKELEEQINQANLIPNGAKLSDDAFPLPPLQQPTMSFKEDMIKKDEVINSKIKNKISKWLKR